MRLRQSWKIQYYLNKINMLENFIWYDGDGCLIVAILIYQWVE